MTIKFLKDVEVPQTQPWFRTRSIMSAWFIKDEEIDPNKVNEEIDLSGLTYRVDYDIISFP